MTWREQAACRGMDPDVFFPETGHYQTAAAVCATCPVTEQCLTYALANGIPFGMWGGRSADARGDRRHRPGTDVNCKCGRLGACPDGRCERCTTVRVSCDVG